MASDLARAHIEGQRRLRLLARRGVTRAWDEQPGYDERHVPVFLERAVPVVRTVQHQSAVLTNAFLGMALDRAPLAIRARVGRELRGVDFDEVYRRPFVSHWTALRDGKPWDEAWRIGRERADGLAAMDAQLAMRGALDENERRDSRIKGYERVTDGPACTFCRSLAGARVGAHAMPLHPRCGCGVDPITEDFDPTPLPAGVSVADHGELGPVLVDPAHDFDHA